MRNGTSNEYIGKRSKPNHADRAVDITAIWPEIPAGDSKRRAAATTAGSYGRSASPLDPGKRAESYRKQTGRVDLTVRQMRQYIKTRRRALFAGGAK